MAGMGSRLGQLLVLAGAYSVYSMRDAAAAMGRTPPGGEGGEGADVVVFRGEAAAIGRLAASGHVPSVVVDALVKSLDDEDDGVRASASVAIGRMAAARRIHDVAKEAVVKLLASNYGAAVASAADGAEEDDMHVRSVAEKAIAALGGSPGVLKTKSYELNKAVQGSYSQALVQEAHIVDRLLSPDDVLDEIVVALTAALRDGADSSVREAAARAVGHVLGGGVHEGMALALARAATRDDAPGVRHAAQDALAYVSPVPEAVLGYLVRAATRDSDDDVRASGRLALACMAHVRDSMRDRLWKVARDDADDMVRVAALEALSAPIGTPADSAEVIAALVDVVAGDGATKAAREAAVAATVRCSKYHELSEEALVQLAEGVLHPGWTGDLALKVITSISVPMPLSVFTVWLSCIEDPILSYHITSQTKCMNAIASRVGKQRVPQVAVPALQRWAARYSASRTDGGGDAASKARGLAAKIEEFGQGASGAIVPGR